MQFICNNEEWRLKRLQKVVRISGAMMGLTRQQFDLLIASIQDDKGLLVVEWTHPWTQSQENAFRVTWGECGELQDSVVHRKSRELLGASK